jgi:septal ring factor EnvC (AmiA/AmiB activator)
MIEDNADRIKSLESCTNSIFVQMATISTDLSYTKAAVIDTKSEVQKMSSQVERSLSRLEAIEAAKRKKSEFWKEARHRLVIPLAIIFIGLFVSGAAGGLWALLFG